MLPRIEVTQKLLFTCELLLPSRINVENFKKWLSAGRATEVCFSEVLKNSEKFWSVHFCTEDESLVIKLQARCRQLALDTLKERDDKIAKLSHKITTLDEQIQASQNAESLHSKRMALLQDEITRLRPEVSKLKEIESQYKSLGRTYRIQNKKLALLEKQVGSSNAEHSGNSNAQAGNTNISERITAHIPVDIWPVNVCIICGKASMPGQGICLGCAR